MSKPVADLQARLSALDVEQSFIVQAPAGSGKTELLIQRYLALLAKVEAPEEIAAITFTRKAAAEMAERVLAALEMAADDEPEESHRSLTWKLARAAAARDAELGWDIAQNPSRLRMQTIDSLCASLTRQMPLVARFGAQPAVTEEADALYVEAARNTLALLEGKGPEAEDVATVLTHLDNNVQQVVTLMADMLRKRDQWLRHLGRADDRAALESGLSRIRRDAMRAALEAIEESPLDELLVIAAYTGANLSALGATSPIAALADVQQCPMDDEGDMPHWLGIAALLLTKEGKWRARLTKNEGFPSEGSSAEKDQSKAMKERLVTVIAALAENDALKRALHDLRALPPCNYTEPQWQVLGAIVRLLPRATAELWSVFAAHGECDFVEIAQAASRALGSADAPTDLALALDYRIRHLLIDEFQDTSFTQFELLEKLTWGWQQGDGRTLFLVGDPMQSIYRFREAEVGLFLKVRESGIGGLKPASLQLTVNFRSQAGVVGWVNDAFSVCMPQIEDIAMGAVTHAAATAFHEAESGDAVSLHALFDDRAADESETEAARVVSLIHQARERNRVGSIAILVRSRTALADIVPALNRAGLAFRAVDIDPLASRPVVRDLLALTRALTHPADRIAWLALLRAPWCGLTQPDLHALCSEEQFTVWESLHRSDSLARLSGDGRRRAQHLTDVLNHAISERRRDGLREAVERVWMSLGGPAGVDSASALDDATIYLDHLSGKEIAGALPDIADFQDSLADLFAAPDPGADATLQIMTIHKAKGLEFDTVIVPGLARAPRAGGKQLMVWVERAREADYASTPCGVDVEQRGELLLAPVREAGTNEEAAYDAIAAIASEREALERTRLMYVAATRARSRLHLLATLKRKFDGEATTCGTPARGSLLASLWPVFEEQVAAQSAATPFVASEIVVTESTPTQLSRLPSSWRLPMPAGVPAAGPEAAAQTEEAIEFAWASPTARHIGTATHRFLQLIAEQEVATWDAQRVDKSRAAIERELARLGVPPEETAAAATRVQDALKRTLADERGRWMLQAHVEAQSELRLTGLIEGEIRNVIVDRTFVDAEGVRWIVDYKTGTHEGSDVEGFLNSEQERYRAQLEGYARLLGDDRPVRVALYFPLLGGWREWVPQPV
jgi:ATP-dependent helicase/nuclease subunit A